MSERRSAPAVARAGRETGAFFYAEMLARLRVQEIPDGPYAGQRPLARASLQPAENWLVALLEAWAMVGDVVGFYQARIAEEGYLSTAREELSVAELVRLLGYPPRPAVAAAAWVAYTVTGGKGMPAEVELPQGAIVQSVPVKGQLPQTFEIGAALAARAEWSQLAPAVPTTSVTAPVPADATSVELAGTRTSLKPGAVLLLLGTLDGAPRRFLRTAEKVETASGGAAGGASTTVSWKDPLDPGAGTAPLGAPQVFVLRREARLFGWNALPWKELPLHAKRQQRSILGGVLVSQDQGTSWQGTNTGLPAVPVNALLAAPGGVLLAATKEGLYALAQGAWQLRDEGIGKSSVQSLAADAGGHLFAGTTDGRVLRSTDGGTTWEALQARLAPKPPETLLAEVAPKLVPTRPPQVRLPKAPVRALAVVEAGGTLLAAGDDGVFATEEAEAAWSAINRGLPGTDPKSGLAGVAVAALAVGDQLYAGTEKGVFAARRAGAEWQPLNRGLPGFDAPTGLASTKVLALLAYDDRRRRVRHLFAGTAQGVFHRAGDGAWRPANVGLPTTDPLARTATVAVQALAVAADPATLATWLYAGTDQGIFRSADLGGSWAALDTGEPPASVSALAAGGAWAAAATPFDGFAVEQWPDFRLHDGTVDLSTVQSEVVSGSWIALYQATSAGEKTAVLRVLDTAVVRRSDYHLTALVSRLAVEQSVDLSGFDLRDTLVLVQSQELPLRSQEVVALEPLDPQVIELLAPLSEPMPPQRPVLVTGKPIRARLPASVLVPGGAATPAPAAGAGAAVPAPEATVVVTVLAPPQTVGPAPPSGAPAAAPSPAGAAAARVLRLQVRTAAGAQQQVVVEDSTVEWMSADPGEASVAQASFAAGSAAGLEQGGGRRRSWLTLASPLAAAYDPQTVVLYANACQALQGESVAQVLGSGNAARTNQTFALSSTPLTYEPAPNPAGMRSTLEVRVDGVLWRQADSFLHAGPEDRVYVVHHDLSGRPVVTFGDGLHGARLPTGSQNVEATYRSGVWPTPLGVNQLALPRTRPLGVKAVTNPLPVAGATPPESLAELRRRAPRSTRPLGRIVSRTDFEDFVLTFPGVTRARLALLPTPAGLLLEVTIAGVEGQVIAPADNLYVQLVGAVAAARLPGRRLQIDSYAPVEFDVGARIRTDPSEVADDVLQRVEQALTSSYGFQNAQFGQVLASSQVLTVIQETPGVVDVELVAFHRHGEAPRLAESLTARLARWSDGQVEPAELLLLDASGLDLRLAGT